MDYKNLTIKTANRIWDAFQNHHMYINKEYNERIGKKNGFITDRDRFVKKFFSKYVGKTLSILDVVSYGSVSKFGNNTYINITADKSVYSQTAYNEESLCSSAELLKKIVKKYVKIVGFESVNTRCGTGYIRMRCVDYLGGNTEFAIDYSFLKDIQFAFISNDEFEFISKWFKDDRVDVLYKCERYLSYEEMVERKIIRKNCKVAKIPSIKEEAFVMAKSRDDAFGKLIEKHKDFIQASDLERVMAKDIWQ